jgi:hypothetical protein
MKAPVWKVRLIVLATVCCCAALGTQPAAAQSETVSPSSLSFGVPTGSTTSTQTATFSVTSSEGPSSVTVSSVTISGPNGSDFTVSSDACSGATLTSPAACIVRVTFTPTLAPGNLESATLSFNFGESSRTVALTGAAGAIKLFNPTFVANSNPNATLANPFTFGSTGVNLSCPVPSETTPITASLSSSPDGNGNVLVDNFLTLAVNGSAVGAGSPPGNVCRGGQSDNNGNTPEADCFTAAYQTPAGASQLDGQNPDTFTNAGNGVLGGAAGGVTPISVSGDFAAGAQKATFSLVDGGGKVASSTLFLVTNCMQAGVQSGGSLTSNPINPNDVGSLTPTFAFDNTAGQHIYFTANYVNGAGNQNGVTIQQNTIGTVTDIGIAQKDFAALVAGTSAAPTVCLRYTGELAADGKTQLCKAFRLQCTNAGSSTAAGINCPQSEIRNLLYETRFDSPDFPPGTNPIAEGTGPGFLMGPDVWKSAADCVFTVGKTTGQLCPQDPLTAFKGAADPDPGDTPIDCNSTFIAVLNMPLPFTETTVESADGSSWQDETTVTVEFEAHPAVLEDEQRTSANGFKAAPIQSVTFGTTPANVPVPDPTFPVPGDQTLFNTGTCPNTTPGIFETTTTFTLAEGRHKLHFFATDCASTEELRFQRSNDPNVNWAKFKTVAVNIDVSKPKPTIISLTPASPKDGQTVTVQFQCTDPLLADGTAGSGVVSCGPFHFAAVSDTGVLTKKFTADGESGETKTFSVTATDRAGNAATVSTNYTIQ